MNGSPCSRNTSVSFRAFFIIRDSFPSVILSLCSFVVVFFCRCCRCHILQQIRAVTWTTLVLWLKRTYQAPYHSGYSYYSYNITYSVRLSCSIPWSGDIEVNPVTQDFRHAEVSFHEFGQDVWMLSLCFLYRSNVQREQAGIAFMNMRE